MYTRDPPPPLVSTDDSPPPITALEREPVVEPHPHHATHPAAQPVTQPATEPAAPAAAEPPVQSPPSPPPSAEEEEELSPADAADGEKRVGFSVEVAEDEGDRPNRLHRRDTPHHLKNKRVNDKVRPMAG